MVERGALAVVLMTIWGGGVFYAGPCFSIIGWESSWKVGRSGGCWRKIMVGESTVWSRGKVLSECTRDNMRSSRV